MSSSEQDLHQHLLFRHPVTLLGALPLISINNQLQ
jgi:hypothetical protein